MRASRASSRAAVVHRPVGLGQVDHRQPGREAPARAGPPHLHARRRQRPPRPQQGPRLHRRGPRREHPPRRRGGEADGRRRPDRAGELHLAVPRRAAHGARAVRRRASSSRSSSTRRWRWPSSATSRACTPRRAPASCRNFTGIDSPYEVPEAAELELDTVSEHGRAAGAAGDRLPARVSAHVKRTRICRQTKTPARPGFSVCNRMPRAITPPVWRSCCG